MIEADDAQDMVEDNIPDCEIIKVIEDLQVNIEMEDAPELLSQLNEE